MLLVIISFYVLCFIFYANCLGATSVSHLYGDLWHPVSWLYFFLIIYYHWCGVFICLEQINEMKCPKFNMIVQSSKHSINSRFSCRHNMHSKINHCDIYIGDLGIYRWGGSSPSWTFVFSPLPSSSLPLLHLFQPTSSLLSPTSLPFHLLLSLPWSGSPGCYPRKILISTLPCVSFNIFLEKENRFLLMSLVSKEHT